MPTAGPWSAWVRGKTICILGPKGDHHKPVVGWSGFDSCNIPLAKQRANARLIAAAPELLEALKAVDLARMTDAPADWERATKLSDAALAKVRPTS